MRDLDLVRPAPGPEVLHFPSVDWMTQAACAGQGFLWDHDAGIEGSNRAAKHAAAIAMCQGCPVLALCATYAAQNDLVGVWGGECRDGEERACGSCRREASLSQAVDARAQRVERARLVSRTPEQRASERLRAKLSDTPERREKARARKAAWKARQTAGQNEERKAQARLVYAEKVAP
jgi:hypothetical protein